MTGDRTLEEFVDAGSDAADAEADDRATDDESVADPSADPGPDEAGEDLAVAPAQATHDWSPDGAACEACGESVERRWRAGEESVADGGVDDPDAMVCDDCKAW